MPSPGDDEHSGDPSAHVSQRPETDTPTQLHPKTASISPQTVLEKDAALHKAAEHLDELLCHKERTRMQRALDHWYLITTSNNLQVSAQASRVLATLWTIPEAAQTILAAATSTTKVPSVIPPHPLRLPQRPLRRLLLLL